MRTRPQKDAGWKVEPLPAPTDQNVADLTTAELVALLSQAYRRIGALEAQLSQAVA